MLARGSDATIRNAVVDLVMFSALPLSFVESQSFHDFMDVILPVAGQRTTPFRLSRKRVRNEIVSRHEAFSREDDALLAEASGCFGLGLVSDGCTFHNSFSMVNTFVTRATSVIRLSMECKGPERPTADAISGGILAHVRRVDGMCRHSLEPLAAQLNLPTVTVVTLDGTNANSAARKQLESKVPGLLSQKCQAHGASKLAEHISDMALFSDTISSANDVIHLIKNRNFLRVSLRDGQLQRNPKAVPVSLLGFCKTRFLYTVLALERLLRVKLVVGEMAKMGGVLQAEAENEKDRSKRAKIERLRELCNSSHFWDSIASYVAIPEPVIPLSRFFDAARPASILWVRHAWDTLEARLRSSLGMLQSREGFAQPEPSAADDIIRVVHQARDKYVSDVHAIAAFFNPALPVPDFPAILDARGPFRRWLSSLGWAAGVETAVLKEAATYAIEPRKESTFPASLWWQGHGARYPHLRILALRLVTQVAASSVCERDWSIVKFVWNSRRNRLKPELVNSLVTAYARKRGTKFELTELQPAEVEPLLSARRIVAEATGGMQLCAPGELDVLADAYVEAEEDLHGKIVSSSNEGDEEEGDTTP
jgi:hypothetical protein